MKKSGYPYGYPAYCVYIMNFRPQAYCLRSEIHGLSHGLKICHRHIFLTAFRVPPGIKKSGYPYGYPDFLVREMGLEPTRRNHTHLKRACLPFQHSRKCHNIICFNAPFVNHYFPISFPAQKKTHAVSAAWVLINIGICGVIDRPIQIGSIGQALLKTAGNMQRNRSGIASLNMDIHLRQIQFLQGRCHQLFAIAIPTTRRMGLQSLQQPAIAPRLQSQGRNISSLYLPNTTHSPGKQFLSQIGI